jgi:Flp pilus assembly protein TadG
LGKAIKCFKKIHRFEAGQAMVEFVVVVPVLVILLIAIQIVAESYLVKHKTIIASRYGTWRLAHDKTSTTTDVKARIARYYFKGDTDNVSVEPYNRADPGFVEGTMDFVNDIFVDDMNNEAFSAAYSVSYRTNYRYGARFLSETLPETVTIRSHHIVDGNTWNGDNTDVHEPVKMIQNAIGDVFDSLNPF